jgi:hypothetical protein
MIKKQNSWFIVSLLFLSLVSCGKKNDSTASGGALSLIGTWGGCITGTAAKSILKQFGLDSGDDSKSAVQSLIFAANFTQENNIFGISFFKYSSADCSTGEDAQISVGGTYTVGSDSAVVSGAKNLNLNIISSNTQDGGWTQGSTVYALYKVGNSILSIGDCFNQTCLDEASRATSLLTGAIINPTQ